MANTHTIACYLDRRHEAAILAGLRLLADTMRATLDALPVSDVLTDAGNIIPLTPDEIDGYAEALGHDIWLCEAFDGPEA